MISIAEDRQMIRKSDVAAMQTQVLSQIALKALNRVRMQIEISHQAIATSHALLNKIEVRRTEQAGHRNGPAAPRRSRLYPVH